MAWVRKRRHRDAAEARAAFLGLTAQQEQALREYQEAGEPDSSLVDEMVGETLRRCSALQPLGRPDIEALGKEKAEEKLRAQYLALAETAADVLHERTSRRADLPFQDLMQLLGLEKLGYDYSQQLATKEPIPATYSSELRDMLTSNEQYEASRLDAQMRQQMAFYGLREIIFESFYQNQ